MARRRKTSRKKKVYTVLVQAGPFIAGELKAKSLAHAKTIAKSVATQLPIAPEGVRSAAAEVTEWVGGGAYEVLARYEPHADGIAEWDNEAWKLFGEPPKIHSRQKKLAVVLNPELIEDIAVFYGGKKKSRRAPRGAARPGRGRRTSRRRKK